MTPTRWKDDPAKVEAANVALTECYEGPWGLKASDEDAVYAVAKGLALDVDFDRDREWLSALGQRVWDWKCETPSPFTEGLASLVQDGLQPGSTVPTAEIAGDLESASWEAQQTAFILDLLQDHYEKEGKS